MELRQLRYFAKVCELGSMGRAAVELGVVTSALSQQISRLESELSTRLLQRSSTGVVPTDAGLAFLHQAQLTLRHAEDAMLAARQARLAGHVRVGLAPTTASVLGIPLMRAMRERYPEVRLHLVEAMSGHLTTMLQSRSIDLAILFQTGTPNRLSITPLLNERLFLITARGSPWLPTTRSVRLADLVDIPLILPSGPHGLRAAITAGFARDRVEPQIVAEVDGLALLMRAVVDGLGATIQPGAAIGPAAQEQPADAGHRTAILPIAFVPIADRHVGRRNLLVSLSDDELSPAGLATRVVIADTARRLVQEGLWPGASLLAGR